MKVRSRILNVFLAIMLVFTTVLSTNREVFAIKTPNVIETRNAEGEGIKEDKDGNYKLTKKIEKLGERKATITIGAEGGSVKSTESKKEKVDIVFLADTSGSMKDEGRIEKLKQALKNSFGTVQEVVDKDADVRVGLVSFAKDSSIKYNLTKVDKENNLQKNNWERIVDSLAADGGTYTDKALDDANRMFNDNSAKKILVLMTDGHPTYSTKIKNHHNSEFYNKIVGNGKDYNLSETWVIGDSYKTKDGIRITNNGEAGILRAKILKGKGAIIYTMGIGVSDKNFEDYLTEVASPNKFYKDASGKMSNFAKDLKNILYKEITTPTIFEETLSDTMGDKVKLSSGEDDIIKTIDVKAVSPERKKEIEEAIKSSLKVDGNKITIDKITLNEGESFTIKYDIEPDLEKIEDTDYDVWLNANKVATLGKKEFPVPQIKVIKPKLTITKFEKGTIETLEGAEFAIYKDGKVIKEKIVTDKYGKAIVDLPYGTYELRETKAPEGYVRNNEPKEVNINKVEVDQPFENEIMPKVQYSAQKKWENAAENNENTVDVILYSVKDGNKTEVQKARITGNAEVKFDEVNKYGEDGKEIEYKVEESSPSIASKMVGEPTIDGTKYIFTNRPENPEKVTLKANKKWLGVTNYQNLKAVIELFNENRKVEEKEITGNDSVTFEVNKFDSNGKEIKYELKEKELEGYVSEVKKDENNYEFTNRLENPEKVTVEVTKVWKDVEDASNLSSEINLIEDEKTIATKNVTGNGSVTFEVNKYDADGKQLTLEQIKAKYTIKETNIPEGYKLESISEPEEKDGVIKYTVTNVKDKEVYRTLIAKKQWLDRSGNEMSNEEANKYQVKIRVSKLVGEEKVQLEDKEVKGNLTITGNGETRLIVPAIDEKGNFIKYYLSEEVIDIDDGKVSYIQRTEDIKDPENKDQVNGLYGVKFINQLQNLDIKKLDGSNNNQPLQGVKFEITKENNKVAVITNNEGMLDSKVSLEEGDYLLEETNAQDMGYKTTTPVTLRVTTDSILLVNKDEKGLEVGTDLLPNGVLKVINYVLGGGDEPKVVPGDKKEEDPTPVPDPDKPQPNPDPQPNPNPQPNPDPQPNPNPQPNPDPQPNPNPQPSPNQDGGSRRNRDNEPNPRRVTPNNEVTVEEETTPLAVPKDDNTNETVLEEEKTPLAVPDKNTDKSEEEVQEDKVPLSLPKTGSQESMLYIILGMAIVVFGIKKYRK